MFRTILIASFLTIVMSSQTPSYPCPVCGKGKVVGTPDAIGFYDQAIGYKPRTCAYMDEVTTKYGVDQQMCERWQFYAQIRCHCRDPTPKPTPKPTRKPTRKPTPKPTKHPKLRRLG